LNDVAEYNILEQRIQHDSRIAYTVVTSFLIASFALFGTSMTIFIDSSSFWESGVNASVPSLLNMSVPILLVILSIILIAISNYILTKFNETGDIRIARAIQIERNNNLYSFRLFPPWREFPDPPQEFMITLGQQRLRKKWDRTVAHLFELEKNGLEEYERINTKRRFTSTIFTISMSVTISYVAILIGIILQRFGVLG
jgi:hypothetical protein